MVISTASSHSDVHTYIYRLFPARCPGSPIITEANLAAAIRNELLNSYQMDPTESGDHLRLNTSWARGTTVQWHRKKSAADDDDPYIVMAGQRRSVLSPGPPPAMDDIAAKEDNKAHALYAEIGENAKIHLQ